MAAAMAYLAAVEPSNEAAELLWNEYKGKMQRVKYAVLHTWLKANRSYCAKLARVVHDELVGLKAITYPDDTKADAESLIKLNAGQEAHLRTCAKAKTFAAWKAAYDAASSSTTRLWRRRT